jgi:hypothetical protein
MTKGFVLRCFDVEGTETALKTTKADLKKRCPDLVWIEWIFYFDLVKYGFDLPLYWNEEVLY